VRSKHVMSDSVRVLLVEDDPAVLLSTQQTLQLAGFEVEPFADKRRSRASCARPGRPTRKRSHSGRDGYRQGTRCRSLHQHSPRSSRPFVAVNCGGMPDQLFESEMFGYEPGSFTDASHCRIGKIQHASGGTLFPTK
jgi:DNA-binding NtrC family response regulator